MWLPETKEFKESPGKHIAKKENIAEFWIKRRKPWEKRLVRHLNEFDRKRKKPMGVNTRAFRNEQKSSLPKAGEIVMKKDEAETFGWKKWNPAQKKMVGGHHSSLSK